MPDEMGRLATLPVPPPEDPGEFLFLGNSVEFAGWWRRVGGWGIDAMIIGVSSNIVAVVIAASVSPFVAAVGILLIFGATSAYYVMFNAQGNQTIGRRILGTRVVREGGDDLSYGLSALRFVSTAVSWLAFLLGVLWPLWDDKKQTFHDKIAVTVVIKT